jgi:hypothetical protein
MRFLLSRDVPRDIFASMPIDYRLRPSYREMTQLRDARFHR